MQKFSNQRKGGKEGRHQLIPCTCLYAYCTEQVDKFWLQINLTISHTGPEFYFAILILKKIKLLFTHVGRFWKGLVNTCYYKHLKVRIPFPSLFFQQISNAFLFVAFVNLIEIFWLQLNAWGKHWLWDGTNAKLFRHLHHQWRIHLVPSNVEFITYLYYSWKGVGYNDVFIISFSQFSCSKSSACW